MSDLADSPETPRGSRKPLLIGLALALLLGAGGFYAGFTGQLSFGATGEATPGAAPATTRQTSFVPVEPITINLGGRSEQRHLRLVAQLEVEPGHAGEVTAQMPRIVDVLNTFLRALETPELEEPAALIRLRAQMLRRIQIVVGPGRVTDLLIMEFIFN